MNLIAAHVAGPYSRHRMVYGIIGSLPAVRWARHQQHRRCSDRKKNLSYGVIMDGSVGLLDWCKRERESLQMQREMLQSGKFRIFKDGGSGQVDASSEIIGAGDRCEYYRAR